MKSNFQKTKSKISSRPQGIVHLVGAGPGDPGLLTLRAKELIEAADVIVLDALVDPSIVAMVPSTTQIIDAGKRSRKHTLSQSQTNRLLVKLGKQGKRVVRLKGGDPFILARGGEEAEVLARADVPFEIVPGVTSALAVPAYAGIPVTHRDFSSSFAVVTGHFREDGPAAPLDWNALSKMETLIVLMGFSNLKSIVKRLSALGKPQNTAVAVIQWGTTTKHRSVTGTLSTIVARVIKARLAAPSVIVIGEVARLSSKLSWFENRPLLGKTVLVTRARKQSSRLTLLLKDQGARVLELPMIEFAPPTYPHLMDEAIGHLDSYDYLVFTSANGVESFVNRLTDLKIPRLILSAQKIAAIGPATQRALRERGIPCHLLPAQFDSKGLVKLLSKENLKNKRILLPRAEVAPDLFERSLRRRGAIVTVVPAYKTVRPVLDGNAIRDALQKGAIDIITFTSSSTVTHFLEWRRAMGIKSLPKNMKIVCIGPVTAQTAKSLGLKVHRAAKESTLEGLMVELLKA